MEHRPYLFILKRPFRVELANAKRGWLVVRKVNQQFQAPAKRVDVPDERTDLHVFSSFHLGDGALAQVEPFRQFRLRNAKPSPKFVKHDVYRRPSVRTTANEIGDPGERGVLRLKRLFGPLPIPHLIGRRGYAKALPAHPLHGHDMTISV
jgi:hypothetical protein